MEPKVEIVHITTLVAKYTLDYNTGAIKAKPIITNADRIRAMSDEELAEWIVRRTEGYGFDGYEESVKAWLGWLREEHKNES